MVAVGMPLILADFGVAPVPLITYKEWTGIMGDVCATYNAQTLHS